MNSIIEDSISLPVEFIQQLEHVESKYWMKYYGGSEIFPSYLSVISGGLACAIPDVDILAMNRVVGLGARSPVDQADLNRIINFYRNAGSSRFFIQLPAVSATEELRSLLARNGFIHYNNWIKLFRRVSHADISVNPELSIRRIDQREADLYGQLIYMSFDWQDTRLAPWLASSVGQEGYHHYIVSKGGKAIAAGALFVDGYMASMAFAGTLEPFRGLGAQSLLLKTRLEDAVSAGAQYITAETAEHREDRPVKSYLNMVRFGFETAYLRENYLLNI